MPHLPRMWGVEIECGGGRLTREQLAVAIRSTGLQSEATGWVSGARPFWRCGTDSSIEYDLNPVEVASPPSTNTDDLVTVLKVLRDNRFAVNKSCGLHVHVDMCGGAGVEGLDFRILKRLVKLWIKYEKVMFQYAGPDRMSGDYCAPIGFGRPDGLTHRKLWELIDTAHCAECLLRDLPTCERMNSLNLEALWRHGTVEFRLHRGSLDTDTIVNWVTLCVYLVELAYRPGTRLLPQEGKVEKLAAAFARMSDEQHASAALFELGNQATAMTASRLDHRKRAEYISGLKSDAVNARTKRIKETRSDLPTKCLSFLEEKSKVPREVSSMQLPEMAEPEPEPQSPNTSWGNAMQAAAQATAQWMTSTATTYTWASPNTVSLTIDDETF